MLFLFRNLDKNLYDLYYILITLIKFIRPIMGSCADPHFRKNKTPGVIIIFVSIIALNGCAFTAPGKDDISEIIPATGTFISVNTVAVSRVADPPLVDRQLNRARQPDMFTNDRGWLSRPRGYVGLGSASPPSRRKRRSPAGGDAAERYKCRGHQRRQSQR